jgi:hypothetical protein
MNQIQEKVKDLVDVRANQQLEDFIADLGQTLSGYYFTDITSDLMAKWLDRVVVMPTGSGNAYALAGYRGVGKSHFLAVFGAILSQPELRARLKDSHVFASAERLIRRHYPVVYVRRGTRETLLDELIAGVSAQFEVDGSAAGSSISEVLKFVSEKGGAGPSVIIIDTAFEREARVSRDDGGVLSEIAEAAEGTNVFVAVALDDDVATADGRNSGIARTFTIDYLDHEHLYKIIDAHIFPKNNQKRHVITQIFENFRAVLPSFRWSEQRVTSVYPLHPVILEVAPFVRLFVHDFALLAFASEAGAKILNRPADSMVALDELFDRVEKALRQSADLKDVFAAYDAVNEKVVNKTAVMERLRAKLVLKGLLMLSLDSEGATASDVASAMLIFDERDPGSAITFVENLLENLIAASEGGLWKMEREGRASKYGFNLSGKEHFNTALSEAVQTVPDTVVPALLKRLMRDRYSDCEFETGADGFDVAQTDIEWRGGVRRGRLIWNIGLENEKQPVSADGLKTIDIHIDFGPVNGRAQTSSPLIQWKPDNLKPEEFDTLRRYHVLMSREDLQQAFRDEVRTTIQSYTIAIEKIWERKFLQYGNLVINGTELSFTPRAAAGHNLSEVFGEMLSGYFESQYPEHPVLGGRLEMSGVDDLSTGLFAARESVSAEVQKLAEAFAVPLGLADKVNGSIQVQPAEALLSLNPVSVIMAQLAEANSAVALEKLQNVLGSRPFGLTFESQCLILTALVARGVIEFVTTAGDRIGSRSLDLKLVWEDIAGITLPGETIHADDKLIDWARLLTGDLSLKAIESQVDRESVRSALLKWLSGWSDLALAERFEKIPDHLITTDLWHLASRVRKSFGAAAEAVTSIASDGSGLEGSLRSIKDAFSGSSVELTARTADLDKLKTILEMISLRRDVRKLAFYEITDRPEVEQLRRKIALVLDGPVTSESLAATGAVAQNWNEFRLGFDAFIIEQHELSSRSHEVRDKATEIISTHEWWVFENLTEIEQFPTRFRRISRDILRELRKCNCTAKIVVSSDQAPFCPVCGFSMKTERQRRVLCSQLWETINQAIGAYETVIHRMRDDVLAALKEYTKQTGDAVVKETSSILSENLKNGLRATDLSENELRLLRVIFGRLQAPPKLDLREIDDGFTPVITAEEIIEDAVVVN